MLNILVALLIVMLILPSCSRLPKTAVFTEEDSAQATLDLFVDGLKTRDRDAVKDIFSKQALNDTKDIEGGINYLFELVKGDITEIGKIKWGSGEKQRNGKNQREIRSWCDITTTEGEYELFMLIYDTDDFNEDNIGLYSLRMAAYDGNHTKHFTVWQDMQQPGIYAPSERDVIQKSLRTTDDFCDGFIYNQPIARFQSYSNYVKTSDTVFLN